MAHVAEGININNNNNKKNNGLNYVLCTLATRYNNLNN